MIGYSREQKAWARNRAKMAAGPKTPRDALVSVAIKLKYENRSLNDITKSTYYHDIGEATECYLWAAYTSKCTPDPKRVVLGANKCGIIIIGIKSEAIDMLAARDCTSWYNCPPAPFWRCKVHKARKQSQSRIDSYSRNAQLNLA